MTLTAGTKLGRYEIRSIIGVGGMGEVYRANDPGSGVMWRSRFLLAMAVYDFYTSLAGQRPFDGKFLEE
jgi:hypothetical protein